MRQTHSTCMVCGYGQQEAGERCCPHPHTNRGPRRTSLQCITPRGMSQWQGHGGRTHQSVPTTWSAIPTNLYQQHGLPHPPIHANNLACHTHKFALLLTHLLQVWLPCQQQCHRAWRQQGAQVLIILCGTSFRDGQDMALHQHAPRSGGRRDACILDNGDAPQGFTKLQQTSRNAQLLVVAGGAGATEWRRAVCLWGLLERQRLKLHMCVCVHAQLLHQCMHASGCLHTCMCACVIVLARSDVRRHLCMCASLPRAHIHGCARVHVCVYVCVCVRKGVHMHALHPAHCRACATHAHNKAHTCSRESSMPCSCRALGFLVGAVFLCLRCHQGRSVSSMAPGGRSMSLLASMSSLVDDRRATWGRGRASRQSLPK